MITGVAVLCDVRGSRRIPDRSRFVRRLDRVLRRANQDNDALFGRFELQAGLDEFAGVVRPGHVGALLLRLWEDLHPIAVRYAVVQGALDVVPEPESEGTTPGAAGFDGPAFHRANEVLDRLRDGDKLVGIECDGEWESRLLTGLGDLLYGEILGWTERQLEVARAYRDSGSQAEAASKLGVKQPTVSRTLSAIAHERVHAARETFAEALDHISEAAVK